LEEFLGYSPGKSGKKKDELLEEAKTAGKWKFNRFVILNYDILDEFYKIPKGRSIAAWEETFEKSPMLQYITNRKTLIIIDEAHKLSNSKSNRYKVIRSLINKGKPDSLYLMTGTPLTNDPTNIYCVLSLLGDPITDDYKYYMEQYCGAFEMVHPKDKEKRKRIVDNYFANKGVVSWRQLNDEEKNELHEIIRNKCRMIFVPDAKKAGNLEELRDRISHIYLRRTKDDLDLPEKRIHELYYDLTDEQREKYDKLWDEYEEEQAELDPTKEVNKELLEGGLYRRYLSNEMVPYTEKLADKLIAKGEKVVIACCYDEEIYTLKDYYGDTAVLFNGKMDSKQKDASVEAFMNDDSVMVFLGNIQSAGVGITLTKSCKLIFSDMSYVPADNEQMQDRVHRIGQDRPVDIYYQIFRDTQYQKMWEIVLRKQLTIDAVIKKEDEK
jgi:SWI/SNF-related matrix-associated actin-dependent regulator 1 of chromatin subfamily A